MLGQSWTYFITDPPRRHDFTPWVELLCSYRRPVVWWDTLDEVTNRYSEEFVSAYSELVKKHNAKRFFHRCYPDTGASVRAAVTALTDAGHRDIAIVAGPHAGDDWAVLRMEQAVRELDSLHLGCRAVVPHEPHSFGPDDREVLDLSGVYSSHPGQSAFRSASRRSDDLVDETLRRWQTLARDLVGFLDEHRGVTGLICLNDALARMVGYGLDLLGRRVPEDLSVVSFDGDLARLFPYNFSSVSPGYGQSGYEAFHLLYGDMPRRRGLELPSAAKLTHEASIASVPPDRRC
jgi:DNA-binding LacI/PurR family transcriptional regulator